ncbi:MAG: site-specific DNA-methyltransferase, partial [Clostridia bacterium]|nr:site-specific DNA-methyltransferase [Clostridia bacterium]
MNILHEDSCAYSFDRGTSNRSTNVSKEKREKLVEKIKAIKTYIATAEQDENTARLLTYIAEIEKDIKGKKYGLVFEEHRESIDEELENNLPVLVEDEPLFVDNGGQMNFLIEGDNLASLKLLEKTHKGKIDLIYIDPPYNTGNKDFVYDDAFVDTNDTFRHSKWLSFMEKRLEIAKNLLSENGAIFISIDDNEQSALKMLCDSIFGEKLTEQYIWCLQDKSEGSFVKTAGLTVRKEHEYIVACFKKSGKRFSRYAGKREFSEGSFSNPDNDPRGPWFSGNISRNGIKSTTGSKYYTITNPAGESFMRNWTLSKEEYDE